jgi:hypothetical protein
MPILRINEFPEGSGALSNDDVFLFMDDPSGSGITKKISLSDISSAIGGGGGNPFDQDLNTTNFPEFSGVSLNNGTTLAQGTFDNMTGGNNGISLNCYVGYELNWQGGHLKSTPDGGTTTANIWCDSPIEFQGSGVDNVEINSSGITFSDGSTLVSKHPTVVQLGSVSGTINTNASLGDIFDLTLAASGTLSNPTNPTDGQSIRWRISHNANNLVLNFGNQFKIPSSATSPLPISSTSGSMDILGATYDSSRNKWDIIAFVPGY